MRHYLCPILLSVILFSCHKSNNGPSNDPGNGGSRGPTGDSSSRPADSFPWKVVNTNAGSAADIWFTSASKGFIAGENALYQSLDSGKTWSKIPNTAPGTDSSMFNLFFVNDTYGYAQGFSRIQVTKDGGNTWSLQTLPTGAAYNIYFTSPSTGYYSDRSNGVYKSTDTGKTWKQTFKSSKSGQLAYAVNFLNPDNGFILCEDGVLSKTADGAASWQQVQQNIYTPAGPASQFNSLQFIDNLTGLYACDRGVLKTTDGGLSWQRLYPPGGNINVLKFFNADTGYYKSDYVIYKTVNGGKAWTVTYRTKTMTGENILTGMSFFQDKIGWAVEGNGTVLRIDQP